MSTGDGNLRWRHALNPRQVGRWLRRNSWLLLVAGAILVLTRTVDFSPPEAVRIGPPDVGSVVGDAQTQEFTRFLPNPQAIQLRATLRWYDRDHEPLLDPDPVDEKGKILAQPVITTIFGMDATIDQTVRLQGGDVEVDVSVIATPRLGDGPASKAVLELEHELRVQSRRKAWWNAEPRTREHLASRGFLTGLDRHPHRFVFSVGEDRFSLELEAHRPRLGANPR